MKNAAWGGAFLNYLQIKFKDFSAKTQYFFDGLGSVVGERLGLFITEVKGGKDDPRS